MSSIAVKQKKKMIIYLDYGNRSAELALHAVG